MSDARRKSLDEILGEVRTLPPEERLRFVREACAGNDEMHSQAITGMRSHGIDFADPGPESPADIIGELIGPYRIVRSLGQGGMGEVFLAERADDQFQQQVAVKLVRRGLLSRHIESRLRQERQILASFDHPNIARLYDGGSTADGTPYIVMEYIDGEPIDVYCDKRRLTTQERLLLFVTICAAVHRAHQSLVVHRDLKPSNILVTRDGVPKLLDFGIAKLLDERQTMQTLALTQLDVRVMTPDHASPEQVRGDVITTASDIYVLGVLLYELLCGFKPIARSTNLAEIERAICEDIPPPLSAVVSMAMQARPGEIAAIAEQRSVSPTRLRRDLRGDLDNVVSMAMRKEPERRYSSVEQFSSDIENHLHGLPVKARPDAWTYRTSKFIRRHAAVAVLSAASLLLLIGFSAITYLQSQRIALERDAAHSQRAAAEYERGRAEAVSTFLIESFRSADPAQTRGDAITAREILDRGAQRISSELRSQPDLQATLLDTVGRVYLSLGLPKQAQPLVEQGLLIRRALETEGLDVARSLYTLSLVHEKQGDLTKAEALERESLDMTVRQTGENSLQAAEGFCRLGYIQRQKGELRAAEQMFGRCLEVRVALLGRDDARVAIPMDNLALLARERGDLATAERLLLEALEIDRRTRGEDHPQYMTHLFHLANVAEAKGDAVAAEKLYWQVVGLHRRVLGPDHPETIDVSSALGYFLMQTGRITQAEQVLTDVLEKNSRLRGPRHAYVGNDLETLGRLALQKGQPGLAESRIGEALDIYQETLPAGHGLVASAWTMLGRARLAQDKRAEAEDAFTQALDAWRIEYGDESLGYALAEAFRGRVWMLQGRLVDAERAFTRSYPIVANSKGAAEREAAEDLRQWIRAVYGDLGRPEAATDYFASVEQTN